MLVMSHPLIMFMHHERGIHQSWPSWPWFSIWASSFLRIEMLVILSATLSVIMSIMILSISPGGQSSLDESLVVWEHPCACFLPWASLSLSSLSSLSQWWWWVTDPHQCLADSAQTENIGQHHVSGDENCGHCYECDGDGGTADCPAVACWKIEYQNENKLSWAIN